ncbi:MAG TPA: ribonucleoside-diphosphate reductase subunit alpha [Acidimicrobiales bacterium]|jgi:ribonucleoside-diphosphate reductase alpha chain|nr:ribonucleoside-diphosphate reductase subunit alpha [Actinomycetota bacterium]MDP6062237.1 ribonucleoside-diphosphate reductase subunit alpha [Acidimicrobiales bacterium]MDP7208480.1 ribonucleoside-diphosphate reductase subunit alpha [Acidimicrobiales bacterium]HJL89922.1 ribonucleoside-diphosphate reductase subunit alpha [Acidimicrobiales bacterium]HJO98591.1 ribonucleoside-diphosphate reductase subunit alpha [Acidimicrobiales bacterium]|tara:strand:- start:18386 stop:20803 length:2418 start_codon:yes stop_codon:yes gene_type:complete
MALTEDRLDSINTESQAGGSNMRVRKRNGDLEPVDVNKIVRAVERCSEGLPRVDPMRIATRTISGLCDGATTEELDELSIRTAAAFIVEEPNYSRLAARLLATVIDKEVRNQDIHSFSQSIATGHEEGLIGDKAAGFVSDNARKLNDTIQDDSDNLFEFFGLRTVYDRYLLRHPESRNVVETPQYFFLRVACGLSTCPDEAIRFYRLMSSLQYLPSSPTLFNSGTTHPQMSSCYLLDSPEDSLEGIYRRYTDIAQLSKFAGGIGVAWHRVRSKGSLIRGTNGLSNGIIPWLKTLDSSVAAVNQGGRRKGAACVYLESWHSDIEDFLDLKESTGDHQRRTHNLNLANWIPDLFMERLEKDWVWSLFDPKVVPHLTDLYGDEFRSAYLKAEEEGLYVRQVPARDLYSKMMRTLAQTGNGWMTFKDASNAKCNQTGSPDRVVHLSNLCTEILEVTDQDETAVCNLGSVNLGSLVHDGSFDFDRLGEVVRTAVPFLDRVIDINFYPTPEAATSNSAWRPVGMGLMGLQDVFFQLGLPFDHPEARTLSARISEEIYFNALWASTELAEASGPHPNFNITRAAAGDLQFDLWGVEPTDPARWETLRERIVEHGLRNSLMIAIAPTATIASIAGCYECIEPQVSNMFKRETLSGEFIQINRYLVRDLQERGIWNEQTTNAIKRAEGSIQDVVEVPDELKEIYRTAWEIPMRSLIDMAADRGAYIDQSQSLNLFMESPTIGKLSSMYLHAWKSGLKTTYYLRSRPATRINKTTTDDGPAPGEPATVAGSSPAFSDAEAVACSLENPETCEACD